MMQVLNPSNTRQEIDLASFSSNGNRLVTIQDVGVASVWDVPSGNLLCEIHPSSPLAGKKDVAPLGEDFRVFIESVDLNNDGSLVLLGLNDGTAGIFSTKNGERLTAFSPPDSEPASHWGVIRSVSFSSDNTLALVGFSRRAVGVWRVEDGVLVNFLSGLHSERLFSIPFVRDTLTSSVSASRDNKYIFAGFVDMTATIWELETGKVVFDAFDHVEEILDFWLGGNQIRWITTGGKIWEIVENQPAFLLMGVEELWKEAKFAPDGQSFLVRTIEGKIKLWSIGEVERTLGDVYIHLSENAKTLDFGKSTNLFCFVEDENRIVINKSGDETKIERDSKLNGFTISPKESLIATYGWSNNVELWQVSTGNLQHKFIHKESVYKAIFSKDEKFLAVATLGTGGDGEIRPIYIWEVNSGKLWCKLNGHTHQVLAITFAPNNSYLASASLDRTTRIWKLDHQHPSNSVEISQLYYDDLEFHNIITLSNGAVIVFRGKILEIWRDQKKQEISIPYSFKIRWHLTQDEKFILGAYRGQIINKWSLETGEKVKTYEGDFIRPDTLPNSELLKVNKDSFSPMAGCALWQTAYGIFTHTSDGPRGWTTSITLTNDEKLAVLPGRSNASLIDIEEQQKMVELFPFEGKLRASQVLSDKVLMVNSKGQLFINQRTI